MIYVLQESLQVFCNSDHCLILVLNLTEVVLFANLLLSFLLYKEEYEDEDKVHDNDNGNNNDDNMKGEICKLPLFIYFPILLFCLLSFFLFFHHSLFPLSLSLMTLLSH